MTEESELNGSKLDGEHATEFAPSDDTDRKYEVDDDHKLVKQEQEDADFEEDLTFDG